MLILLNDSSRVMGQIFRFGKRCIVCSRSILGTCCVNYNAAGRQDIRLANDARLDAIMSALQSSMADGRLH